MFAAGATHQRRPVLAGNRQRKTNSAGFEVACHLTGDYPGRLAGERINHPILCWAFGVDSSQVRDVLQKGASGKSRDDAYTGDGCCSDEVPGRERRSQIPGGYPRVEGQTRIRRRIHAVVQILHADRDRAILVADIAGSSVDLAWVDEQPPDG